MAEQAMARVYELRRDEHDRPYWHELDAYRADRRAQPDALLSIWIAEHDPPTGTYRIETAHGARAEVSFTEAA